ncbi:MAG TPA: GGDEF domain-containing protein [Acidimicrobiia bacterium]
MSARERVWAYCAVGLIAIMCSVFIASSPLRSGQDEADQVHRDDLALAQVAALRTTLADFQVFAEPRLAAPSIPTTTDVAQASNLAKAGTAQAKALVTALRASGLADTARALKVADVAYTKATAGLEPVALGLASPAVTAAAAAERAAYTAMWAVTNTAATQLRQSRDLDLQRATTHLSDSRRIILLGGALAAIATLSSAFIVGQRAHRRELAARTNARRHAFETSLQDALDMAKVEPDVYTIVGKAVHDSVPQLQVEMLIADSSRAHFHQTVSTHPGDPDQRNGCGVVSPFDCPATTRGHTLVFPTSTALNACPYLQDRASGDCSCVCVPISIAGKTVGVTHATGPDGSPPNETDIHYLEITSRRAADRLAMLRAFAKSETQASSDPLTGLWNRRSLENRVHDLHQDGVPYAVAYGDLDHFKLLNDTHGHEAGDQALRLFSRVLRDSIRPNDIAGRYGGEEFVIVLPDCNTDTATVVLERVRERLALALTAGRVAAFTVSFGLAASTDGDTFDEAVAVADQALHTAKATGRNRVVTATNSTTDSLDDAQLEPTT